MKKRLLLVALTLQIQSTIVCSLGISDGCFLNRTLRGENDDYTSHNQVKELSLRVNNPKNLIIDLPKFR